MFEPSFLKYIPAHYITLKNEKRLFFYSRPSSVIFFFDQKESKLIVTRPRLFADWIPLSFYAVFFRYSPLENPVYCTPSIVN